VEEKIAILTSPCMTNAHARTGVVQWTANSLNGVRGEGVPRHVEEAHSYALGDARARNVEGKDVLDL